MTNWQKKYPISAPRIAEERKAKRLARGAEGPEQLVRMAEAGKKRIMS